MREKFLIVDEVEYGVQVNGKMRDRLVVKKDADKAEVEQLALGAPKVKEAIGTQNVVKVHRCSRQVGEYRREVGLRNLTGAGWWRFDE